MAEANKLIRVWNKADIKAKQQENNFKKFLTDNKILIEGDFGDIVLNFTSDWNYSLQEHVRRVYVDVSSGVSIKQKLFEEILLAQIEAETLQELEVKAIEATRGGNFQKLLA